MRHHLLMLVVVVASACSAPTPERLQIECADGEVPLQLNLHDKVFTGWPVEGVHVCIVTHPDIPCLDSDGQGRVGFCAPQSTEIAVSYEKEDFMPTVVGLVTGAEPPAEEHWRAYNLRLSRLFEICNTPWLQIDEACPPTTRALLFIKAVEDDITAQELPVAIAEVTVTLDPPAEILVFETGNATVDRAATSTYRNGNAFAAGLRPGDDQLVLLSHPTRRQCRGHLVGSWPSDVENAVRVPIRAGFRTFATVTCTD